jgi:hypothetical protein
MLFHELAHIYAWVALNTSPAAAAQQEAQAIELENQYRDIVGLTRRSTNPTQYGPHATSCSPSGPSTSPPDPDAPSSAVCSLRSLTEEPDLLHSLRVLRDELVTATPWGRRVFPSLNRAYRTLSPWVVRWAKREPRLRSVFQDAVAPTLHLLVSLATDLPDLPESEVPPELRSVYQRVKEWRRAMGHLLADSSELDHEERARLAPLIGSGASLAPSAGASS